MRTIAILFISAFVCGAQNVAVLTHGAANTPEFQRGCPSNWPAKYFPIGKATEVPRELQSPPWIVETEAQMIARKASLEESKEAWNVAQEAAATQPKRDRETVILTILGRLKTLKSSTGPLTDDQRDKALREIAAIIEALIEEIRP